MGRGAEPEILLTQLQCSIDGLYMPKGHFDQCKLDVVYLAKALGGPHLLNTLMQFHGFALVTTLQQQLDPPHITPCISTPTAKEISVNISALCNPNMKPPMLVSGQPSAINSIQDPHHMVAGNILTIDAVTIEEKCCFLSDINNIIGLCHEHSSSINTQVTSFKAVKVIKVALHHDSEPAAQMGRSGSSSDVHCCYRKDVAVVVVMPYAQTDHYTPVPLLISASCKSEKGTDMVGWICLLLDTWKKHPFSEQTHGPFWALASNGESSFQVKHMYCLLSTVYLRVSGRVLSIQC